ncbi:putative insuline-like growth factor family member [Lymphocystis disease virus 3]|uniref:Insuline-like growth factor family member n=1 Tax=Lymphocystis disease virus 3 TaxID=2560566 RepID=A0A1B2RW83_9VIRU|nr:putative insuline-like growth factor family member [Lymphocystis disease virus Sa]AOC55263.1 putative insuline-like growth factor family member [Lymphocystis disease virus 3]
MKGFLKTFILIVMSVSPILCQTLCGSELVDALELVCGEYGGIYRPPKNANKKPQSGKKIVDVCCTTKGCNYMDLKQYCNS